MKTPAAQLERAADYRRRLKAYAAGEIEEFYKPRRKSEHALSQREARAAIRRANEYLQEFEHPWRRGS